METQEKKSFHVVDHVVFVLVLAASLGIGLYHAFTGGKQRTTSEYLMADRKLRVIPVAMSMLVSIISAMLIIGIPTEVYFWGTQFWMGNIGLVIGIVFAALIMAPVFYPLKLTSVHEYLELRYRSQRVKQLGCMFSIMGAMTFMGIQLFLPAAAVEVATKIPIWASLLIAGSVATTYTTLGGMKAVIWTDVFQTFVILAGMLAILIQGLIKVGGFQLVWQINRDGNRLNFFDFNADPTKRMNFWGLSIGNSVLYIYLYGFSQAAVQRYSSTPSLSAARKSILMVLPGHFIVSTLAVSLGMVIYAFYYLEGCDPMKEGFVKNPNQIVPYFVVENLNYPGLPGLFTACIWAGSLSTLSSMLTSMATNLWADFLSHWFTEVSESRKTLITKISVFGFGACGIGMAYLLGSLGGLIWQTAVTFGSATFAPVLTLFLLGLFFPFANKKGAFAAAFSAFAVCLWIGIGSFLIEKHLEKLPVPDHNCSLPQSIYDLNGTMVMSTHAQITQTTVVPSEFTTNSTLFPTTVDGFNPVLKWIYSISFLWIKFVGVLVGTVCGVLVSLCTGRNKDVDRRLVIGAAAKVFGVKEIVEDFNKNEKEPLNMQLYFDKNGPHESKSHIVVNGNLKA